MPTNLKYHLKYEDAATVLQLRSRLDLKAVGNDKAHPEGDQFIKVSTRSVGVYSVSNKRVFDLIRGKDIVDDLLKDDEEIESGVTGWPVSTKKGILVNENGGFVFKYEEYKVIKDPSGNVVKREKRSKPVANINLEDNPLRLLRRIPRREVIKRYSFKHSYQIFHHDELSYGFLYDIANDLYRHDEVALVSPLKAIDAGGTTRYQPARLRLRTGDNEYWGWIEGRLNEKGEYALILHLTDLELI